MKKLSSAQSAKRDGTGSTGLQIAVIEAMSAQGQGVTRIAGGKVFIPFTLPGEQVIVEVDGSGGRAAAIEIPSPGRIPPPCRHFGVCGGCSLQHWSDDPYRAWKEGLVTSALARAGLHAPVEPLRTYPVPSRRRASFTARSTKGGIQLGYLSARTHVLADLEECPILLPRIASALPPLKAVLTASIPARSEAKIYIAAAANGLDCSVDGPPLSARAQATFAEMLAAEGFIRVIWNGEALLLAAAPFVFCGGVRIELPANAFLQAIEACEVEMANWVLDALSGTKAIKKSPICDLFAGLGAFTFPAAKLAPVMAYEENPHAVAALSSAAKHTKGLKPVTAVRRDLFRNPLSPLELGKFAAVIMDPPREGAEAQCRSLGASKTTTVAMLSCNPSSFARDAAILAGAGFQLSRLAAFDQFRFSAHVEIAALFQRPPRGSR
jgi:23S rRNA (uracil1939-C5)-methyltransferase